MGLRIMVLTMPPIFHGWNFMLFQLGENTVFLNLGCEKLKGPGELIRILNMS